ncbi:helix-turn-helix domain-containing protein [Kitasatospora sp. NPDC048407]|uniref:helix-turn-helix domain-containing protein n=1 Tax=Kitasatospora sp. NPDC048407 TaxID=3364051 RepID=UPI0037113958
MRRSRSARVLPVVEVRPEVISGEQAAVVITRAEEKLHELKRLVLDPKSGIDPLVARRELADIADALDAAVVQQARERGSRWESIGGAHFLTADTLRKKWTPVRIEKALAPYPVPASPRVKIRPVVPRQQPRTTSTAREAVGRRAARESGSSPSDQPGNTVQDQAQAPPGTTAEPLTAASPKPGTELTTALSGLRRRSGLTLKAIADEARIDSSYITHILAGKRIPSWPVTRSIAKACGADPATVRPQWEATRSPRPEAENSALEAGARLHDLVCDLYQAASRPAPSAICKMAHGRIDTRDVAGLIDDGRIPDWHTVEHVVTALRGQPSVAEALWDRARSAWGLARTSARGHLPACAFG